MLIMDEFSRPQVNIGCNLFDDLSVVFRSKELQGHKALLLTSPNNFDKSSWKSDFLESLRVNNLEITRHIKVQTNPSLVAADYLELDKTEFNLIICVGGGSVTDFAKLLKLKYFPKVKIFSFYTLVGSGSIVTPFVVFDNHEFKIGEHSEEIIPDFVYINEKIIDCLSIEQKLSAICDISAHAIESYLSNKSTVLSRGFAEKSLGILQKNILNPEKMPATDIVMADIYSAFSESIGMVLFPHAVGHYLTYRFGIQHNIASIYCLREYLDLLDTKDVGTKQFLIYLDKLMSILDSHSLIAECVLRNDQIDELMQLVGKYMNFVYENSPIEIEADEYLAILRSKRKSRKSLILSNLNETIRQAKKSEFYADKLKDFPDALVSLDELRLLPFTSKEDLRSAYPFKSLAVDMKKVIEMHTSSGTTGKPTLSFYSEKDITNGSRAIAEAWANFGINQDSRVQFVMSYGLFSGAMLNTYALQQLGAFVLPSGIQPIEKQINLLVDFEIDTIVATPSYLLHLADYLEEHKVYRDKLKLIRAIAAGEVYSDSIRKKIEDKLNIRVYDHYGLCEVNTGIAYECSKKEGLHILDDYVYPEVINPTTGELLADGEYGELVLTSLKKEASPIIRYRTGDITCIKKNLCRCGDPRVRIDRIKNRVDDMLFIKGLKINPHELKESIVEIVGENIYCGCIKISVKKNSIDFVPEVLLFVKDESILNLDELRKKIKDKTQIWFNFQAINFRNTNLFENNKIKMIEYVD